jgi:acyl carrier protein
LALIKIKTLAPNNSKEGYTMSETVKRLREYIFDNFLFTEDENALANDDSFMEQGIIDSTGILEVITFIEEDFGFKVKDEEMLPENLDSINNLSAFIQRKKT